MRPAQPTPATTAHIADTVVSIAGTALYTLSLQSKVTRVAMGLSMSLYESLSVSSLLPVFFFFLEFFLVLIYRYIFFLSILIFFSFPALLPNLSFLLYFSINSFSSFFAPIFSTSFSSSFFNLLSSSFAFSFASFFYNFFFTAFSLFFSTFFSSSFSFSLPSFSFTFSFTFFSAFFSAFFSTSFSTSFYTLFTSSFSTSCSPTFFSSFSSLFSSLFSSSFEGFQLICPTTLQPSPGRNSSEAVFRAWQPRVERCIKTEVKTKSSYIFWAHLHEFSVCACVG